MEIHQDVDHIERCPADREHYHYNAEHDDGFAPLLMPWILRFDIAAALEDVVGDEGVCDNGECQRHHRLGDEAEDGDHLSIDLCRLRINRTAPHVCPVGLNLYQLVENSIW